MYKAVFRLFPHAWKLHFSSSCWYTHGVTSMCLDIYAKMTTMQLARMHMQHNKNCDWIHRNTKSSPHVSNLSTYTSYNVISDCNWFLTLIWLDGESLLANWTPSYIIVFQIIKQSLWLPWHGFANQWINTGMPGTFQTIDTWVVIPSKAGLVAHRLAVKISWIEVRELKVPQSLHTAKWEKDS